MKIRTKKKLYKGFQRMKGTVKMNELFSFTLFYNMRAKRHSMKLVGSKFISNNK